MSVNYGMIFISLNIKMLKRNYDKIFSDSIYMFRELFSFIYVFPHANGS